ncbi:MAG: CPBP family intramembrane metalloprotease [Bacteroidales bacterium]|nr:CPBP family intramembrane metalloprotease [Bacteroidales bacterium]
MNSRKPYLVGELTFLFVLIPSILLIEIHALIKVGIVLIGVIYILRIVIKNQLITRKSLYILPLKSNWKFILIKFIILIICTTILMYIYDSDKLFIVVRKNLALWLGISIIYSILSVFPQEYIYRSFFFKRYIVLFKNPYLLIGINALVFSFAHIGFKNILVLFLTLIGGFIFAITYTKTRSLLFTSFEHAIYGSWLFTVGMGEMLAFPMPE